MAHPLHVDWKIMREAVCKRANPFGGAQVIRIGNVDFYYRWSGPVRYTLPYAEWDWSAIRAELGMST